MPRKAQPCVDGPDPCPCRVHARIKARQRTRQRERRAGAPRDQYNRWTPEHDGLLRRLLSFGQTPEHIAEMLTRTYAVPRTPTAVKVRAVRLGRSLRDGWYSATETYRMLGVSDWTLREWTRQQRIPSSRWGRWLRYRQADVEQFVVDQAGRLIDPRHVRDPRLRSLAETAAVVNRRRQSA